MQPMQLYTGCDMALPAFEQEIVKFEKDADFKFSLTKEQAYGEHDDCCWALLSPKFIVEPDMLLS